MLPTITILGRELPMYGLMMITGAFFAIFFACLRAKKRGVEKMDILLAAIFCLICGLLGAKLLFIITRIPAYIEHFKAVGFSFSWLFAQMANAGIVFYGGLIGGVFGGWLYMRLFRLDFWKYADSMLPFLPLAHGFGRIGCFCAGCCYGRSPLDSDPAWLKALAVTYEKSVSAPNGIPLYPVQLFEACFLILILFPVLQIYMSKERKHGQIIGLYFLVYGIFRFINEYMRDDQIRGVFGAFSTSQWISVVLMPLGVLLLTGVLSPMLRSKYAKTSGVQAAPIEPMEDDAEGYHCAVCTECGECGRVATEQAENARQEAEAAQDDAEEQTPPEV